MESPNLFDYATSELSQDAFLCYMLAFGKEKFKTDFSQEYALAHKFLEKCGLDKNEEILSVGKQVDNIDVLIITDKHILIIEDKTYTTEHDDQIVRYVKNMRKSDDKFLSDKKIKVCYLKTGDYVRCYSSSDETILKNQDCCSLRRKDILDLLKDYYKSNQVFGMFYQRLLSIETEIQKCDENNIFEWNSLKWFDFLYNLMQQKNKYFDIKWVHNPKGGFYGCWFDYEDYGSDGKENYKQIEISFKNNLTSEVKLCLKFASDNSEITRDSKSLIKDLQEKAVLKSFIPSNRLGRTTTYAYKIAKNKKDVLSFIDGTMV